MRDDLTARVTELQRRRDAVVEGIDAIPGLSCVTPQGGWWLLVDHREVEADDETLTQHILDEVNVALTPMHTWGPSTAVGHFRIIFSNESVPRLREAVELIGRAVKAYAG